jgi:vacuolar-type H+-ATPase subunit H
MDKNLFPQPHTLSALDQINKIEGEMEKKISDAKAEANHTIALAKKEADQIYQMTASVSDLEKKEILTQTKLKIASIQAKFDKETNTALSALEGIPDNAITQAVDDIIALLIKHYDSRVKKS